MNIRLELETELSKRQIIQIANYVCRSKARFNQLMLCFFDENHRIVLKASWVISKSLEINPKRLDPFIPAIIQQITNPNHTEHLIRNSLRILELIDIPEAYHGVVMNTCFDYIENPTTAIAIKAYALTIIYHLSLIYPAIQNELICIIEEKWENETPAFKSRGKKILSSLKKSRKQ